MTDDYPQAPPAMQLLTQPVPGLIEAFSVDAAGRAAPGAFMVVAGACIAAGAVLGAWFRARDGL